MSGVVSIRVSDELRGEMDRYRDRICWNEELREFIQARVEEQKRQEAIDRLVSYVETLPGVPAGTAARMVREDRDSH
ncbi:hypothetical protein DSECCO2_462830 [anaerobic digester metagenome]